jgi:hypothetical protein
MDAANNLELIRYYKDRHVWLVQPDSQSEEVSPYPMPEPRPASSTKVAK